jgi:hypothetical protein
MREAVKKGNAAASSLALLEDRIALRRNKLQIYGSQVAWNMVTNNYYVLPLADPDNVDDRRLQMGMAPLATYLSQWKLEWDVTAYKKALPELKKKHNISPN